MTRDCKRMISISADGCIFVWKFSKRIHNEMKQMMKQLPKDSIYKPSRTLEDTMNNNQLNVSNSEFNQSKNNSLRQFEVVELDGVSQICQNHEKIYFQKYIFIIQNIG